MKLPINEKQMQDVLDTLYRKSLDGIPKISKPIDETVNEYLTKNATLDEAVKSFIKNQVVKCGTSGFITGLGGLITLPVALPANVGSVLYIQMRMIAVIASMGGFDVRQDQVQTLAYACLTGSAVTDILKQAGIKVGERMALNLIKKIPATTLKKINQKIAMRLVTKFGEKGIVNLGKMVPFLGGIIGGGIDVVTTNIIANNAYNIFIKKQIESLKKITT